MLLLNSAFSTTWPKATVIASLVLPSQKLTRLILKPYSVSCPFYVTKYSQFISQEISPIFLLLQLLSYISSRPSAVLTLFNLQGLRNPWGQHNFPVDQINAKKVITTINSCLLSYFLWEEPKFTFKKM